MSSDGWNLLTDIINRANGQPQGAASRGWQSGQYQPGNGTGINLLGVANGTPSMAAVSYSPHYGPGGGQTPNVDPLTASPEPEPPANAAGTINDAKASPPTYKSLKFDPEGPGHWGVAIMHPFDAKTANDLADEAIKVTQNEFPNDPGGWDNDEADAFRHAYWSLRMSQALGPDIAKKFGDAHEISVPNPDGERLMDLYNNQIGRGLSSGSVEGKEVDAVKKAIHDNLVRTRKF